MSDRHLQDELIRALADPAFRDSEEWRRRNLADPDPLNRFARFLARHFYFERVFHFFKYSRALSKVTGRMPEHVLSTPHFEKLLPRATLGSRRTAEEVGALVTRYLRDAPDASRVPYLEDLLAYEAAMMAVESGPRQWNGEDEIPTTTEDLVAEVVEGTIVLDLEFDLPSVLESLLGEWQEVPRAPNRRVTLIVARTRRGRVTVIQADESLAGALEAAIGTVPLGQMIQTGKESLKASLRMLADAGAVRFYRGS